MKFLPCSVYVNIRNRRELADGRALEPSKPAARIWHAEPGASRAAADPASGGPPATGITSATPPPRRVEVGLRGVVAIPYQ